ncbi:GIY-YIG nuclease family protein [Thalassoporum mexicanum]|uniref:GIY-YIG nuclease family protein n=1 Tax=Thalassoporum mexicanum TaxID=3457544 RepID=UPI0030DC1C4D
MPIHKLNQLPRSPGIYYITAFWLVFYVGKATNLRRRWSGKNHQRYNQFKILAPFARLHYKTMPRHRIDGYEKAEIDRLRLPWNQSRVPDFYGLVGFFIWVWFWIFFYFALIALAARIAFLLLWQR